LNELKELKNTWQYHNKKSCKY